MCLQFLIVVVRFCNFCSITGSLSISSNRYDPPWRSNPRLIFLSKKLSSNLKRFDKAIKINKTEKKAINIILNLEK